MINNKLMILAIFIISLLAISAVSAHDNAAGDIASAEETSDEYVSIDENQIILSENNNVGTFDDLQKEINNAPAGSVLNLTRDYNGAEDKVVRLNKDLTIDGQGHTIDCKGDDCSAFYSDAGKITLKNLKIINGYNDDNYKGGAIYIGSASQYTIINCTFNNNWADDYGGAIYNDGINKLTIINCSFNNNEADDESGGAIYSVGDVSVENSIFKDNSAEFEGGAVFSAYSVFVHDSIFDSNRVEGAILEGSKGGAIKCRYETRVYGCEFVNNFAGRAGGAIYVSEEKQYIIIKNCQFINNKADGYNGGAICSNGYVSAENSIFKDNSADDDGGAIFFKYLLSLKNCNLTGNKAGDDGGAVCGKLNRGDYVWTDFYVDNCIFEKNSAGDSGGAIYFVYNQVKFFNSTFKYNTADDNGGAIYAKWISNGDDNTHSNFIGNTANEGGAIYTSTNDKDLKTSLKSLYFYGNKADRFGGAIFSDSDVFVYDSIFDSNRAEGSTVYSSQGGAIKSTYMTHVYRCEFVNNFAENDGGAIYGDAVEVQTYSYFENNEAYKGKGGAIWGGRTFFERIEGGVFINNKAGRGATISDDGGAIYIKSEYYYHDILITRCIFIKNSCTDEGGAIYSDSPEDHLTLKYNVFVDNYAGDKGQTVYNCGEYDAVEYNWHGTNTPDFDDQFKKWHKYSSDEDYTPKAYARIGLKINDTDLYKGIPYELTLYYYPVKDGSPNPNETIKNMPFNEILFYSDDAEFSNPDNHKEHIKDVTFTKYGAATVYAKLDHETVNLNVIITNSTFSNLRALIGDGGNIKLPKNCKFTYDYGSAIVITTDNTVIDGNGAVIDMAGSDIQVFNVHANNVTFKNLTIINVNCNDSGGAIYFTSESLAGTVENCKFINNTALYGGAIYFSNDGTVNNCIFLNNSACNGSAIYFNSDAYDSLVSNSTFLNNTADSNRILITTDFKKNLITIVFKGNDNLLNAIYSNRDITFTNVTYWGADGTNNTGTLPVAPMRSENEAGQNITTYLWISENEIYYTVDVTDANGTIILDYPEGVEGNYTLIAYHGSDSYYSEIYNYTSNSTQTNVALIIDAPLIVEGQNATVSVQVLPYDATGNVTLVDVMGENLTASLTDGVVDFVIPNLAVGNYTFMVVYSGARGFKNATSYVNITVEPKKVVTIDTVDMITTYKSGEYLNATLEYNGAPLSDIPVSIEIDDEKFVDVTDSSGQIFIPLNNLAASATPYMVNFTVNTEYYVGNRTVQVTIKKAIPSFNVVNFIYLWIDESESIKVSDIVSDANPRFTYTSSDDNVFRVVGNVVSGVGEGVGNLTVTLAESENYTSLSKVVPVHVNKRVPSIDATAEVNGTEVTIAIVIKNYVGLISMDLFDSLVYLPINTSVNFTQNLTPGTYSVNITALGNDLFGSNWEMLNFTVPEPEKLNTTISAQPSVNRNTVTITVNINQNATGYVEISIAGNKYCVPVDAGKAVFTNNYPAGIYSADITYMGDNNYNPANATAQFSVIKQNETLENTSIKINVVTGENYAMFTVNVNESATGLVEINIAGEAVYLAVNNGQVTYEVLIPGGDYTVTATYLGDDRFNGNSTSSEFTVKGHEKVNTTISTKVNVDKNTATLTVNVNENATGFVEIAVAGKKYYVPVDAGKAVFSNDYSAGTYGADITYLGDDNFNPAVDSATFTVIEHNITKKDTPIDIGVDSVGNNVTITVNVDSDATGLVEISIGDETIYLPVNNGKVTGEFLLPGGDYEVTATYMGDAKFNANTTSKEFTVKDHEKINTAISAEAAVDESSVTIAVYVNENATGFVEIGIAGKKYYVPINEGKATWSNDYVPGTYATEITYLGDDNYNPAKTSTSFTVIEHNETKMNTPIDVEVDSVENNVTVAVNVNENATGLIEININGEAIYLPVNNGMVVCGFALPGGDYKVTATYLGDAKFNANTTSTEFTVKDHEKANTTIAAQTAVDGNTVTITVNVNENATGFAELRIAGKKYYVHVNEGKAIFANDYLPGTYVADITYMGDDNYNTAKTSASFTVIEHNTTKKDTPIGIDISSIGNNVTITVSVDSNATGLVEINVDGKSVYLPLSNGAAICGIVLPGGDYKVTATYLGDANFNANITSAEFTVKGHEKVNTTISTAVSVDNNTVTLTVSVNKDATGFVEILVAGKKYYVPVKKGKATLVNDYLSGTYGVDITYMGDDNFNPAKTSTSFTVIEHNATKKDTPIDISVFTAENNVTIEVSVDSDATGLVEISIGNETIYLPVTNGVATGEFLLPGGDYEVTATYMGDNKFNANTTSAEFTVKDHEKVDPSIKSQAAVDGNTVTITVNVNENATGFVEISIAGKNYYVPVEKGKAVLVNDYLTGTYVADITYMGDDNYNTAKTSTSFTVIEHNITKKDTPIDIGVSTVENNVTITVNIDPNATGLVEINIGNETIYLPVNNGAAIGEFLLPGGDYEVAATYLGDAKYNANTTSAEFTVKDHEKVDPSIKSRAAVDGNTVTITVNVNEDATGFVEINIAGKKYYVPVDAGEAKLVNDYLPGTYGVDITYMGDDNYNTSKTSTSFTVIEHNATKKDTPIDIAVDSIENNVTITVNIDPNATGLVEINIGNEAVYLPANNGVVISEFLLDNGDYNVTATYLGDNKFNGNTTSAEFTVEGHVKANTTISASAISIENTAIITIKVNENATGFVKLTIGSTTANVKVEDGVAIYNAVLPEGNYSFKATYRGDDNFNENTTSGTFTVSGHLKRPSNIDASVSIDGDKVSIDMSVPGTTGYVTLDWGENLIYVPLENGSATFEDEFESGSYEVNIVYSGDDYYLQSDKTINFTIGKTSTKLTASDVTMIYNGGKYLVATLKDADGNAVSDAKVTLKLGNITKTLTTDSNGQVSLSLNGIIPDVYTATITFDGDGIYDKSSATAKVTITKLQSKVYLRNALYFTLETKMVKVVLWDADNKPVAGKTVHITLNEYGLTYSGVTDENGVATIRVGVGFGVHSATVSFDGDEIYDASNRTGSIRVIKETPSIMVRGANTHFKASTTPKIVKVYLWDRNSKPLPVNSKVAIKINGQTFVGYTNNQGIASVKVNVNTPGIFNAQVTYAGNSAYNGVSKSVKFVIS